MSHPHIYISGPMTGYAEFNFPAFSAAAENLRAAGYTVTSPHEFGEGDPTMAWEDYLRVDLIAMLQGCTAVATLDGWEASRGAQLEVHVAKALSMPVRPAFKWLSAAVS
jgi:hypothetical protein